MVVKTNVNRIILLFYLIFGGGGAGGCVFNLNAWSTTLPRLIVGGEIKCDVVCVSFNF